MPEVLHYYTVGIWHQFGRIIMRKIVHLSNDKWSIDAWNRHRPLPKDNITFFRPKILLRNRVRHCTSSNKNEESEKNGYKYLKFLLFSTKWLFFTRRYFSPAQKFLFEGGKQNNIPMGNKQHWPMIHSGKLISTDPIRFEYPASKCVECESYKPE